MERKLYKSEENKMICGVCGGIAEYFNLDPTVVRLGFVVAAMIGSFGIWGYIAAAFIVPSAPDTENEREESEDKE